VKRSKGKSPTQLTLEKLREDGYLVQVTERWNPFAKIRQDLFGFVDVLAVKRDETLAVQCTSADHVAERVAKIANHDNVGPVREAGWRIEVWGWRKVGGRWKVRVVDCS